MKKFFAALLAALAIAVAIKKKRAARGADADDAR